MATLTADRHLAQRSLLDPHEEAPTPMPAPRHPQPRDPDTAHAARHARPRDPGRSRPTPSGPTLDDLIAGTWDALTVTHAAACPVCGDDLTPRWSSGPHPVAARCSGCGSELT